MKSDDIKNAPKLFCESINIAFSPEFFVMSLSSGSQAGIYALTPEHAKRLQQYLSHQLADYEKTYGEISAEWTANIVSPLQPKSKSTG